MHDEVPVVDNSENSVNLWLNKLSKIGITDSRTANVMNLDNLVAVSQFKVNSHDNW